MEIKGSELFVKALLKEKVDILFAYPGGQAIDLFDALYDQDKIEVVLPRHEQALVHAADGYARSTGKVGVCLVTSGPGATNLVTGIATANYDSVPLVCFTGQVPTNLIGNDAFQEVDIDSASISRNIVVDIPIVADAKLAIKALLEKATPLDTQAWVEQITAWKKSYPLSMKSQGMTPQIIIEKINKLFNNSIVVTDVGQNQLWATQFLELDDNRKMLTSGGLGTMGYGFPAAIGAKMGNPDKDVIAICGDGGVQMNIQELATAVVYEIPLILCILNNGYLGNVRQWQEMFLISDIPAPV